MELILLSDMIIENNVLKEDVTVDSNWIYSQESLDEFASSGALYITQDLYFRRIVSEARYKRMRDILSRVGDSNSDDDFTYKKIDLNNLNKYGWGSNEDANDELHQILGEQYVISYPKPIKLLTQLCAASRKKSGIWLDYFSGSCSTACAIINLNRLDKNNRKYIMAEMSSYLLTVSLPRIKKYIYSSDWKYGKPVNRNTGVSHIMKYIKLESYEDALSNIELDDEKHGLASFLDEDYLINYMLDLEAEGSLLNLDAFKNPFEFKLKVNDNNETKTRNIDIQRRLTILLVLM